MKTLQKSWLGPQNICTWRKHGKTFGDTISAALKRSWSYNISDGENAQEMVLPAKGSLKQLPLFLILLMLRLSEV